MKTLFTLAVLLLAVAAVAQGGPPLLTDDPGTVEPGKWEINLSWINRTFRGRSENEFPHFDASHGFTKNAHFKIEVPWVFATENRRTISGDGGGSTGIKWRFVDAKGRRPAVSVYPQIGFSIAPRSVQLGLSEGGSSLLLPTQVQWDFRSVSVNADFGALLAAGSTPGWLGGVAVGRTLSHTDLLAEIHGEGIWKTGENIWIAQLGLRHSFSERATLLLSFGRSIAQSQTEAIRWNSYLGIQLHY